MPGLMDLCLMIEGQDGVTWPRWLALAEACEAGGIATLYRSDHHHNLSGVTERGSLDAWGTITALAARTTTLRFGTLVSPVTFRHPSELAKLVVVADHVSDGRVELGLGAGWNEREHAAYGFPFPPLPARMEMLAEQLEIVRGHWAEGAFSFTGEHYRLDDLDARPKPLGDVRLLMGGKAGPRAAALAARWADEYNTAFASLDELRPMKARVDAACEAAGREPIPFSLMTGVVVGRDRAEVDERVRRLMAFRADAGDPGEFLASTRDSWLIGTVEEVAERLHALREAGVARVMCQHLLHDDVDAVAVIGRELAPLVA
jgi:alkanesulfonate monooxygenase SsuD/methylene tetrahydromethanopterin reductase-like flavin-dependent oxidoreductase (luciferase family)